MAYRAFISLLALASLLSLGCATQTPPSERIIKAVAIAHPPIREVVPVFVAMNCENCEHGASVDEPFIERTNVYALNRDGQYVQAVKLDDAVRDAGGWEGLSQPTNLTHSQSLNAIEGGSKRELDLLFTVILLPFSPLLARPAEEIKVYAMVLQEDAPTERSGPSVNYNNEWVFFPLGKYTGVRLDVSEYGETSYSVSGQTRWSLGN